MRPHTHNISGDFNSMPIKVYNKIEKPSFYPVIIELGTGQDLSMLKQILVKAQCSEKSESLRDFARRTVIAMNSNGLQG